MCGNPMFLHSGCGGKYFPNLSTTKVFSFHREMWKKFKF
jgi:hypothetical protein